MYHHIWAEINLNALSFNIKQILKLVPAKKVMGVIKANAYGHGAAEVLNTLLSFGIENFAVSNVFEALDLRTKQKNAEILILGYCDSSAVLELAKNNITASVFDDKVRMIKDIVNQFVTKSSSKVRENGNKVELVKD